MEIRATPSGASVSKTFVAAVLVIVAMGMAAMGGYATRAVLTSSSAGTSTTTKLDVHPAAGTVLRQDNPVSTATKLDVHPAAGTVLRQDNPVQASAELPSWLRQEITPKPESRISVDDPSFWRQYLTAPVAGQRAGGHREV